MELQRQRRTRREHFDTEEEYREFADRRNQATKKCRKEKEEKLRKWSDLVPQLQAENKTLREQVRKLEAAIVADNEKDRQIAALEKRVRELELEKVGVAQTFDQPRNDQTQNMEDWEAVMAEEWGDLRAEENVPVSPAFMSFILDDNLKA